MWNRKTKCKTLGCSLYITSCKWLNAYIYIQLMHYPIYTKKVLFFSSNNWHLKPAISDISSQKFITKLLFFVSSIEMHSKCCGKQRFRQTFWFVFLYFINIKINKFRVQNKRAIEKLIWISVIPMLHFNFFFSIYLFTNDDYVCCYYCYSILNFYYFFL